MDGKTWSAKTLLPNPYLLWSTLCYFRHVFGFINSSHFEKMSYWENKFYPKTIFKEHHKIGYLKIRTEHAVLTEMLPWLLYLLSSSKNINLHKNKSETYTIIHYYSCYWTAKQPNGSFPHRYVNILCVCTKSAFARPFFFYSLLWRCRYFFLSFQDINIYINFWFNVLPWKMFSIKTNSKNYKDSWQLSILHASHIYHIIFIKSLSVRKLSVICRRR